MEERPFRPCPARTDSQLPTPKIRTVGQPVPDPFRNDLIVVELPPPGKACVFIANTILYIHNGHAKVDVDFTWDERKNRANRRKHRLSFQTAILVFDDPFHLSVQDREVEGVARWQTIGMAGGVQVLVVAHTVDEEAEVIRILSARKATPRERRVYAQGE